jgi:phosphate starvation-inducible PhoH-like protein
MSRKNGRPARHVKSYGWDEYRREADSWQEKRDRDVAERSAKKPLRPLTDNQKRYVEAVDRCTVTIVAGPPGSGKTYCACGIAARMLKSGDVDRVVVARPLLTCGEELGFLPGDMNEKVSPYLAPVFDSLEDFFEKRELQTLVSQEKIVICPLAVMRGRSFKKSFVILDEANNATYGQLRMFLTRFGEGSKVVVSGDLFQSDLTPGRMPPLLDVMKRLNGHPDISIVQLTDDDVVRHPLIRFIEERLHG